MLTIYIPIYILKLFYLQLNQTQEIFDLFDELISNLIANNLAGNITDPNLILEYEISGFMFQYSPELMLSMCRLAQEVKYESEEYSSHIDFVQQLESFIKPLDKLVNTNFKNAFSAMLIQLGNELDDALNPKIAMQDRYLPIFYAFNTWTDVNLVDYKETLDTVAYPFEKYDFLKYTMRSDQLSDIYKMALAIYNFILIHENCDLEIKTKDIITERELLDDLLKHGDVPHKPVKILDLQLGANVYEEYWFGSLEKLIGGF